MLSEIKSKYIIKYIFKYLLRFKYLDILRHNKALQNSLQLSIKDYEAAYKEHNQIEIEIIPEEQNDKYIIINYDEKDKSYFHIYYDDENKEREGKYLEGNPSKIKVKIDVEAKNFQGLFQNIFNIVCVIYFFIKLIIFKIN